MAVRVALPANWRSATSPPIACVAHAVALDDIRLPVADERDGDRRARLAGEADVVGVARAGAACGVAGDDERARAGLAHEDARGVVVVDEDVEPHAAHRRVDTGEHLERQRRGVRVLPLGVVRAVDGDDHAGLPRAGGDLHVVDARCDEGRRR